MADLPKPPTRNPTLNVIYTSDAEVRAALKAAQPDIPPRNILKVLNEQFRALTPEQRRPFEERFEELKAQYEADIAAYKKEHGDDAPALYRAAHSKAHAKANAKGASGAHRGQWMSAAFAMAAPAEETFARGAQAHEPADEASALHAYSRIALIQRMMTKKTPLSKPAATWTKIESAFNTLPSESKRFWKHFGDTIAE